MACTRPLEASRPIGSSEKPLIWKRGTRPDPLPQGFEPLELPCGQCIKCRLEYSRTWAARMIQEDYSHYQRDQDSIFVTLTYREPWHCTKTELDNGYHVPLDGSLNHSHIEKFFKRLRKHFNGRTIRYYQCGEYGDETNRPHHHAVLYNVGFSDQELIQENNGYPLFVSEQLDKLWKFGYCWFGSVTFESAAYVARYCLKKITGPRAHEHYLRYDEYGNPYWLRPEYCTMSQGLGRDFYEEYKSDMYPSGDCPVPGRDHVGRTPRYFDKLHEETHPQEMEELRQTREKWYLDHHGEMTPQRLETIEKCALARISHKKRRLE